MIEYKSHTLPNGLRLLVHEDPSASMVCLNILYKVGSRNEDPSKTGFAHLFEHLMFGGSQNIDSFDEPLQAVGGDNNAFTNTDITNYYITVPSSNVETAFWLESDRMLGLSFDPNVLEVQRKVVIEEFKQRYLNQPYGDIWLKLRKLAYTEHPYQWPTIGKEISHIEQAIMDDVRVFFNSYYHPGNAILVVAGDITEEQAVSLTKKWFGSIPTGTPVPRGVGIEPAQQAPRLLKVTADVPADALYKAYHIEGRLSRKYHVADLLSDVLGNGRSSMLYNDLVKEKGFFSSISAYITGSFDPGLLVISGRLLPHVTMEQAEQAILNVIDAIKVGFDPERLEKAKNQAEATTLFASVELLNRAMALAYAEFLGDASLVNTEQEVVKTITYQEVMEEANNTLKEDNCSTLYYYSESKNNPPSK